MTDDKQKGLEEEIMELLAIPSYTVDEETSLDHSHNYLAGGTRQCTPAKKLRVFVEYGAVSESELKAYRKASEKTTRFPYDREDLRQVMDLQEKILKFYVGLKKSNLVTSDQVILENTETIAENIRPVIEKVKEEYKVLVGDYLAIGFLENYDDCFDPVDLYLLVRKAVPPKKANLYSSEKAAVEIIGMDCPAGAGGQ